MNTDTITTVIGIGAAVLNTVSAQGISTDPKTLAFSALMAAFGYLTNRNSKPSA